MFPPRYLDAVKLGLLNEPIYHGKLPPDVVSAKLKNMGDFLVQDGESDDSIVLSVFKDGVRDFLITIEQAEESPRYLFGRLCFASVEELTFKLKSVQCGSEVILLETAIYRNDDCGRLGAHCFADIPPRTTMKTMIPLPPLKYKSILVALKKEMVHHGTEEELESLMFLKHKHLVKLEDFATYPDGSVILRYEMHNDTCLYDIMREKLIGEGTILVWIQQAASLAFYLAKKECLFSVLCAQDCYLDAGQNIKFFGAWNNTWPTWQEDTLRHTYYWRFVAPESLLHRTGDSSSVIWNLGVFMWQLSVSCQLTPFFQHRSRNSYLEAVSCGNLNLVDHKMNINSDDLALLRSRAKMPQCIESMISECVQLSPGERCLWSTILNTTKTERRLATLGGTIKQIFPFV